MKNAQWIWRQDAAQPDEYVDFRCQLTAAPGKTYQMTLAADSNYSVYINGKRAVFGQYADYPVHKVCDSVDITPFLTGGVNEIVAIVYYLGVSNYGVYAKGDAGFIYEITENGTPVLWSDEKTESRLDPRYRSHAQIEQTFMLGYVFCYDSTAPETDYVASRVVTTIRRDFESRPNKKLILGKRVEGKPVKFGTFSYNNGETIGQRMQYATLTEQPLPDFSQELVADGSLFFMVQLPRQDSGFVSFRFTVPKDTVIDIGYGEHLLDGRCRTDHINYSAQYIARKGVNEYTTDFRRFGCRYLQFFVHGSALTVESVGLCPTDYPLSFKPYDTKNELRRRIYEAAVNTLRCNMHEHYEDSCCREQGLYALDSRNEMLFTYAGTGDTAFARSCLMLMHYGYCPETGLLRLTYPSDAMLFIPSYSLVFPLSVKEYGDFSGDLTLAETVLPTIEGILRRFAQKKDDRGVISNFQNEDTTDGSKYWEFFDWTPTMHADQSCFDYEAPLNAWYAIALGSAAAICRSLGKTGEAAGYEQEKEALNRAIKTVFFVPEAGLFKSFEQRHPGCYSVYTQALCLLCGAADETDKSVLLRVLATNGEDNNGLAVEKDTLASCCFRYDALLREDKDAFSACILKDMDDTYGSMLEQGATSFWETILGADDPQMGGTGSLCHAWSSAPIRYYPLLAGDANAY